MPKHTAKKRRLNTQGIIAFFLVLVGVSVLLYPVIATQWNNISQRKAAAEYSKLEQSAPQEVLNKAWEDAHYYNEHEAQAPIVDAWTQQADVNSPEYQHYLTYLSQLADTDAMGQIVIPAIDSQLPIYHGTSDESLNRGVGHLYGTDLPVGGTDRNAVLSAHTGIPHATLWDDLIKVKEGDAVYIAVAGHKLKYEVDHIQVVEPHETDLLRRQPGRDLITLITCTPYGINTHRLIVTAHQVPMDENDDVFTPKGPKIQWWMWALVAAASLILLLLFLWLRRSLKTKSSDVPD